MNKMNRGDTLVREIYKYAKLHTHIVNRVYVRSKTSRIFLRSGAKSYIGSIDYVDGNAKDLCLQYAYFTGLLTIKTLEEAFQEASLIDDETRISIL